jgi:hypothetical protein
MQMLTKNEVLVCALSLTVALSTACHNETLVTKIDPAKPGSQRSEGVIFSLPETVVVADVSVTRSSGSPGRFASWTELFYPELTSNDYTTENRTSFKVGSPSFTTRGQTDPNNVYMAHIKAKQFETKTLLLEFNDDGIIARTEAASKDESIDILTSGIKTVASFAAPLLGGQNDDEFFRSQLPTRARALYDTLDQQTKDDLKNILGYSFLLYVIHSSRLSNNDSSGIEFFLTLNENQWKIIKGMPRDVVPCPGLPVAKSAPQPNGRERQGQR